MTLPLCISLQYLLRSDLKQDSILDAVKKRCRESWNGVYAAHSSHDHSVDIGISAGSMNSVSRQPSTWAERQIQNRRLRTRPIYTLFVALRLNHALNDTQAALYFVLRDLVLGADAVIWLRVVQ